MTDRSYKQSLLELLATEDLTNFSQSITHTVEPLKINDLANIYVDVAFLVSAIKFIGEELWIQNKDAVKEISFSKFIKKLFKAELSPVLFLHDFFERSSLEGVTQAGKNAELIEKAVIQFIKTKSPVEQKAFAGTALKLMSELFELEHQMSMEKEESGLHLGLSLYRTFDMMDEIFNLNYSADTGMISPPETKERLYEGAGIGVQSGYSTALIALRYLNPAKNSKFVDLGSGYGRIGLIVGLMRPDIDFIGYEYVPHRVDIAAAASLNLSLDQHVHFNKQDLSLVDFKIPVADTYYIYDSFTEETYQHIIAQLVAIGSQKKITVVTKGNARQWMEATSQRGNWSKPQQFDNGNLCFFRSQ